MKTIFIVRVSLLTAASIGIAAIAWWLTPADPRQCIVMDPAYIVIDRGP